MSLPGVACDALACATIAIRPTPALSRLATELCGNSVQAEAPRDLHGAITIEAFVRCAA